MLMVELMALLTSILKLKPFPVLYLNLILVLNLPILISVLKKY